MKEQEGRNTMEGNRKRYHRGWTGRAILSLVLCLAMVIGPVINMVGAQPKNIRAESGLVEGQPFSVVIDMEGAEELRLALPQGVTLVSGGAGKAEDGSLILKGQDSVKLNLSADAGSYSLQLKHPDGSNRGAPTIFTVKTETEVEEPKPTVEPKEEPTAEPTDEPTEEPAENPTVEPTEDPSAEPTVEPTEEPTAEPAAEPTEEPVVTPAATPVPMKELTLTQTTKDGVVITVAGLLPEGTVVQAVPVQSSAVEQALDSMATAQGKTLADYAAYDITLYDRAGNEIQPAWGVQVTIKNPDFRGESEKLGIAHVNDAQTGAELVAEGTDTATVDHFSIYAVVTVKGTTHTVTFEIKDYLTSTTYQTFEASPDRTDCWRPEVDPAHPVVDGFAFQGWVRDLTHPERFNFNQKVTESFTLYAWFVPEGEIGVSNEAQLRQALYTASFTNAPLTIQLMNHVTLTDGALVVPTGMSLSMKGEKKLIGATGHNVITTEGMLSLTDVTITHEGRAGRGIEAKQGLVSLTNVTITDNHATGNGGGLCAEPMAYITLAGDLTVTKNTATGNGGGLYGMGLTVSGGTFTGNTAGGSGGGAYVGSLGVYSSDFLVYDNEAEANGGGIYTQGSAMLYAGKVDKNTAKGNGGGLYVGDGACYLYTTVSNNKAGGNGGGLYLTGSSSLSFGLSSPGTLFNNTAAGNGGGLFVKSHDKVYASVGGTISANDAENGGGVYFETNMGSTLELQGKDALCDNTAVADGGGAYLSGDYLMAMGTGIKGNTAGRNGGGVYNGRNENGHAYSVAINGYTQVSGNVAGRNGGGIWVAHADLGSVSVGAYQNTFSNNKALYGTDVRRPSDDETYEWFIKNTEWTSPFTQGYNNYDIAYPGASFNVKFDANGGSGNMEEQEVTIGEDAVLFTNTFTREGYLFTGWNTKADGTGTGYEDKHLFSPWTMEGDMTLYAQWKLDAFTVQFVDWNGKELKTEQVVRGSDATAPSDPRRAGYAFTGWDVPFTNVQADLKVTAQYQAVYTVTYAPGAHGTFRAQVTGNLRVGVATPSAPTVTGEAGWNFTGWSPVPGATVMGNATYTAQWEQAVPQTPTNPANPVAYTVRFVDWNGTVIQTQQVEHGGNATAPANPTRQGYTFTGWDVPFTNVTGNLTVTAQYAPILYAVTYNPGNHGTFAARRISGLVMGAPTPAAPAIAGEDGWIFAGWQPRPSARVTGNATYTAQWRQAVVPVTPPAPEAPVVYTIQFVDWDGEVLKTQQVERGNNATPPADPVRDGYTFTHWDGSYTNVQANQTVVARYVINPNHSATVEDPPDDRFNGFDHPPTREEVLRELENEGIPSITVLEGQVPLAAGRLTNYVWALVNLILMIIGVVLAVVTAVRALIRKKREEKGTEQQNREQNSHRQEQTEDEKTRRLYRPAWFFGGMLLSVIGLIFFFLTENMRLPMVLVDDWTIWQAVILVAEIVGVVLAFKGKKKDDPQDGVQSIEEPA